MDVKIIKIGGALLKDKNKYKKILESIVKEKQKIILVVSAIGRNKDPYSTDGLNSSIKGLLTNKERNRLKAIGETYSVLKVTGDLRRFDRKIKSYSYKEFGLTINSFVDYKFNPKYILDGLKDNDICVVPGFIGRDKNDEPNLFQREGSDLSAIIFAIGLKQKEVFFYKDIKGIYDRNGKIYKEISYEEFVSIIDDFSSPLSRLATSLAKEKHIAITILNHNSEIVSVIK